jgi:hypothetical protein
MAMYPHALLKQQMEYYIKLAKQTPEVQAHLKTVTLDSLHPEAKAGALLDGSLVSTWEPTLASRSEGTLGGRSGW